MHVLELAALSKRFGGNEVLSEVDLTLNQGEHVAIIGPNGAGKSTLFNTISGQVRPSGGRIRLCGRDVTSTSTHRRVQLGIGRSFQLTSLLVGLTVMENMLLALQGRHTARLQPFRSCRAYPEATARARDLLLRVDLWSRREDGVASLSYGQQKKLEVAMSLALSPRLLLLDEPTAGLALGEVAGFMDTIRSVVQDTTLLFTEHDMDVVFGLADRIIVLYFGRIIAQGTPQDIQQNAQVREIYLGVGQHAPHGSVVDARD